MAATTGLYASAFPASGVLVGSRPLSIYIFAPYSRLSSRTPSKISLALDDFFLTPLKLASKVRREPSRVLGSPLQSLEDNMIGNLKPYTKNDIKGKYKFTAVARFADLPRYSRLVLDYFALLRGG